MKRPLRRLLWNLTGLALLLLVAILVGTVMNLSFDFTLYRSNRPAGAEIILYFNRADGLNACWRDVPFFSGMTTGAAALSPGISLVLLGAILGVAIPLWLPGHPSTTTLCETCGYDLRATPDRCPECGTLTCRGVRGDREKVG